MSTSGKRLGIPAPIVALVTAGSMLLVAGCSNDDDPTLSSVTSPAATPPASDDVVFPSDTSDIPLTTGLNSGTADIPIPPPIDSSDIALPLPVVSSDIPLPIIIEVTVGVDAAPERLESVPLGSDVVMSITNPNSDDEFHLHGYELGDAVVMPAGETETLSFLADQAGDFELESHETGEILLILSVS